MKITPLVTEAEVRLYDRWNRLYAGKRKTRPGKHIVQGLGISESRAEHIRRQAKRAMRA